MKLLGIPRTYRNLARLKDIVLVLTRHGFGNLVDRVNLAAHVPVLRRLRRSAAAAEEETRLTLPQRLVLVLQELGPTFVKFGQVLATRPDLLPASFIQELAKLHDSVAPFPASEAREIVTRELGRPIERAFRTFEDAPAASGSIAQVHFAELEAGPAGGERVAVKVKRPGAGEQVLRDLDLLDALAQQAERHIEELRIFRPVMLVEEFGRTIRRELDFVGEAATLAHFGELFADDASVHVPRAHWDLTSRDVLVMERLDGVRLTDREALRDSGVDLAALGASVARCFMRQFFEFGRFHADPHPGNVLVLEGGRLGLLDLGASGHLSDRMRGQLALTLLALSRGDVELILDVYAEIGVFPEDVERRDLAPDVQDLIDRYYGVPAAHIDTRAAFEDAVRLAQRRGIVLPREFVMLGRSFVLASALVQDLAPGYDLASTVRPYVRRLIASRLHPRGILRKASLAALDLASFLRSLPGDLKDIVRKIRAGRLAVTFRHAGLDELARELDRASNRLAFAIVIGSVIVGSALLLSKEIGPTLPILGTDLSALGLAGFLFAGALGLVLAWGIWRSGKV